MVPPSGDVYEDDFRGGVRVPEGGRWCVGAHGRGMSRRSRPESPCFRRGLFVNRHATTYDVRHNRHATTHDKKPRAEARGLVRS
jgi:hypothetical protein